MSKIRFSQTKNKININNKNRYSSKSNKKSKKSWYRYWQYYKLRILRLKENPSQIARGFAAGVFAGCLPLMGVQFVISLLLSFLVKGNKFCALIGTWISNPFTYVPLFFLNFKVGKLVLNLLMPDNISEFSVKAPNSITDLGQDITIALSVGSLIVASVASVITYYFSLKLLKKWKKNQRQK